jgi:hypothetical protein
LDYHYQRLCIVNPHLFKAENFIDEHFQKRLPDDRHSEHYKYVGSSLTLQLSFLYDIDVKHIHTLHLDKPKNQEMYEWVIKTYPRTLAFLLPDGLIYKYHEIPKMLVNGEFKRIAGKMTQVSFSQYEYGIQSQAV